jgi:hypothetical protein
MSVKGSRALTAVRSTSRVDELIERYQRAARKLWMFCGSSGFEWERTADMLAFMRENGETHDWWDAAARRKR